MAARQRRQMAEGERGMTEPSELKEQLESVRREASTWPAWRRMEIEAEVAKTPLRSPKQREVGITEPSDAIQDAPLTRWQCLTAALLDAQAAVDALRRGQPLAADIYLKLAIDYIQESGVLP